MKQSSLNIYSTNRIDLNLNPRDYGTGCGVYNHMTKEDYEAIQKSISRKMSTEAMERPERRDSSLSVQGEKEVSNNGAKILSAYRVFLPAEKRGTL